MNVRKLALQGLIRVLEEGSWLNKIILYYLFKVEDQRDRNLLTELLYGTVKQKLRVDWTISKFLKKYRLENLPVPIRNILRLGCYEILFLEKIPVYATVHEYVELAKKFGHCGTASLVNALLRRISSQRHEPSEPWIKYSHPEWLYRRWEKRFGEEKTIELMKFNNSPHEIYLRVNTQKISPEAFESLLLEKGINFKNMVFPETYWVDTPPQFRDIPESLYVVQDFSTQFIAHCLSPVPSSFILDLAAAPGIKTTHISQVSDETVYIVAVDKHKGRASLIKKLCKRLEIDNIDIVVADSRNFQTKVKADYILLDVPCSGLGTLRRKPEIKWRLKEDDIKKLATTQMELLENASSLLKKNGVLLYSTCTTEPEENENIVKTFLQNHSEFIQIHPPNIHREFIKNGFLWIEGVKYRSDFFFAAMLKKIKGD